jgi:hypothetical protein
MNQRHIRPPSERGEGAAVTTSETPDPARGEMIAEAHRSTGQPKPRHIRGRSKRRIHVSERALGDFRAMLGEKLAEVRLVGAKSNRDFFFLTAQDVEDIVEDAAATAAYAVSRNQESVPASVVDRLIAGENPIRVWREHRGLTLSALAAKARVGKGYLSQLETRERRGTVATLRKLARLLSVDLDDLVPGKD